MSNPRRESRRTKQQTELVVSRWQEHVSTFNDDMKATPEIVRCRWILSRISTGQRRRPTVQTDDCIPPRSTAECRLSCIVRRAHRSEIRRRITMQNATPEVDAYIAGSAAFARPILKKFRALFHRACPEI